MHTLRILSFFLLSIMVSLSADEDPRSHVVLVTVSPYKFFVEELTQGTVKVIVMVPAGSSAHTYEPTPKQMLEAANADLWFSLGESFEGKAIEALQSQRPELTVIDMREGVSLIGDSCHEEGPNHICHGADLHFWLSPIIMQQQVRVMASVLSELYPENAALYGKQSKKLLQNLKALDKEISEKLRGLSHRTILVSHPAYGYYCRNYRLTQASIEFEGKDPTPRQLTDILALARRNYINTIFIQKQYPSKGARLIAQQIGAKVVMLDPYSENYFPALHEITDQFALSLKRE